MGVDWNEHLDAIYDTLGVEAVFSLAPSVPVTVINHLHGVEIFDDRRQLATVRAVIAVRSTTLAELSIERPDLPETTVTLSDNRERKILSTRPRPTPDGEDAGEVWLILSE